MPAITSKSVGNSGQAPDSRAERCAQHQRDDADQADADRMPSLSAGTITICLHAARQAYILMDAGRSLDKVSQACTKSLLLLKRWSVRYGWVESAHAYDDICGQFAASAAADAYRREVEAYCERYAAVGRALYTTAAQLLVLLNQQIDGIALSLAT
jgi:hypothetical protein